ncbi:MAG: FHA domain-containing protein [Anaerolineae bacterium]
MIRCPSCGAVHPYNTLFCDQCGARLTGSGPLASTEEIGNTHAKLQTPVSPTERPEAPTHLILVLGHEEMVFPLPLARKVVLGRFDPARRKGPDVDLAAHQAYERGVSRQHAVLYQSGNRFYVEDLSSRNGTFVNGQRLEPFQACPVDHGDEIRLGTLPLVLLLR